MIVTLKEVFDKHLGDKKFDAKLASLIHRYQINYINQNREHMIFFGSNLLGVQVIRFKDSDLNKFYNDVLDIDYIALSEDIQTVSAIDPDYKVSSDVFNLTIMYLVHRFMTSPYLTGKAKTQAMHNTAILFFIRCMAALLSAYFKYPADPETAQATYAALSGKHLIKKLGTWLDVMRYRADEFIGDESIHIKALEKFNDDYATVYAVNDSQGRIRAMIINIYGIYIDIKESGGRVSSKSGTFLDAEGEETVKEKVKSVEAVIGYMRNAIIDKNTFINQDMIGVINDINTNTSIERIRQVLNWIVENYNNPAYHQTIDDFMTMTIIHSFHLIQYNMEVNSTRDYPLILMNLKNLYLATRSTDVDLLKIRTLGEKIIKASSKRSLSKSLMLSTRTSIILYISLRALVGNNA